jgi:hypothetical protein
MINLFEFKQSKFLRSRGLTLPPILFIDAVEEETDEDANLFECSIYNERGWLKASFFFEKTDILEVNSENTYSIRCVYFSILIMATSNL